MSLQQKNQFQSATHNCGQKLAIIVTVSMADVGAGQFLTCVAEFSSHFLLVV